MPSRREPARQDSTTPDAEFLEALNRHGYAFQQAVLHRSHELFHEDRSNWIFDAAEFPIEVQGHASHVDFVLRGKQDSAYLVAECKRVDPALGRWCFARAPFTHRNASPRDLILDQIRQDPNGTLRSSPQRITWATDPYQIGVEVKTNARGDGAGSNRDSIEKAVTQALRGASGVVNHLTSQDWSHVRGMICRFVPAVFTTAEIWTTDADLTSTDVATGKLPSKGFKASKAGWIWYNYNISPQLRHGLPRPTAPAIADALTQEAMRSVAIVSPSGIDDFLARRLV
jgi:hypothetical protein